MYNGDKTWDYLARDVGNFSKSLIVNLVNGNDAYNEWQSYRAGRTNLEIATALSRLETEVAEMDAAYAALKMLYDYANNQTPTQSDYFYSMRKFS